MPIHIVSQLVSNSLSLDYYGPAAAAVISLILLKKWSAGTPLLDRLDQNDAFLQENGSKSQVQDLHGKTFIVSGGFTPYGLTILSNLSNLGAQLICLTQNPTISHPETLQLIQLLRDGTNNRNIFAEHCSLTNLSSIDAFVTNWNKGNSSIPGERPTLRRLDGIIFLGENHDEKLGFKKEINGRVKFLEKMLENLLKQPRERNVRIVSSISPWYPAGIDVLQDELKGPFGVKDPNPTSSKATATSTGYSHSIDPSSHPTLKQRKINPSKRSQQGQTSDPDFETSIPLSTSRLRIDGSATLLWLLLSASLQRRLDEISLKDTRSSHSLYEAFGHFDENDVKEKENQIKDHLGRDIQPPMSRSKMRNNINVLNVCEGFERNRDVIDYLKPRNQAGKVRNESQSDQNHDQEEDESSVEEEKVAGTHDSDQVEETISNPKIKLKESIDPRYKSQPPPSTKPTNNHPSSSSNLESNQHPPNQSSISSMFRYILLIVLYPLIWLFSKSPSSASQSLIWSILSPISDLSQGGSKNLEFIDEKLSRSNVETETSRKDAEIKRKIAEMKLVPGELYREGKIVALSLPSVLLESGSTIPSTSTSTPTSTSSSSSYSTNRTPTALPISSVPTEVLSKLWERELKR